MVVRNFALVGGYYPFWLRLRRRDPFWWVAFLVPPHLPVDRLCRLSQICYQCRKGRYIPRYRRLTRVVVSLSLRRVLLGLEVRLLEFTVQLCDRL